MRTKYHSMYETFVSSFLRFMQRPSLVFNFSLCNSNNLSEWVSEWVSVCVCVCMCVKECVSKLWKISKGVCMCIFECVV